MSKNHMGKRFRGFMPVVIDVETGGIDPDKNPLLEVAAVFLKINNEGIVKPAGHFCDHVVPFKGSIIEKEALEINQIDPDYPLRFPRSEKDVITDLFKRIDEELEESRCRRAILIGHNANFDLSFINNASKRNKLESLNRLHRFSVLDTVTIGALMYGQTILSLICQKANIEFDEEKAHSALYDAQKTAELFCKAVNNWLYLGGWRGSSMRKFSPKSPASARPSTSTSPDSSSSS